MGNKQNKWVQQAMKSEAFRSLLVEPDQGLDKYLGTRGTPKEKRNNESEEPSREEIKELVEWAKNRREI